jgi:hypothetical protein
LKGNARIYLPLPWKVELTEWGFDAVNPDNGSEIAGWRPIATNFENGFTNSEVKNFGIITTERISIASWEKQSFQREENSLVTIFKRLDPNHPFVLICKSRPINHTELISQVLSDILKDLSVE